MNDGPKSLKVGLIGCGWVSQHHLRAWRGCPDAEVVVLVDPSPEARDRRGDEFGIAHRFGSMQELIDSGLVDAVDIATPRETHADIVRAAARAGLPVLCQKPLAPTLPEAEALVKEVATLTRLMVHENWRFRPYIRDMARLVANGDIGAVKQCRLTLFHSGFIADGEGRLPAVVRQPFFASLERMLVMEVLIHHIDALRFIFGKLNLKAAHWGHTVDGVRGDDFATITLEGSGPYGPSISIMANMAAHGYPNRVPDELVVLGDKGTLILSDNELRTFGEGSDSKISYDPDAVYRASYSGAIGHFVSALREGGPFETSPEDNLETLRLVEAIYQNGVR
uniref:Gfo/Idh/MocA family protein n=1 Tax=Aminobacter niigataensis TaxID=83265 RepID=UPI0028525B17|nr:Gfo/Idh/MocA family oxidoreductase [Aminobacter niigataensis]WMD00099.1 Gfo/Idh/MocA family oxidoreductase [Aminobacter niigataensis]